MRRRGHAWCDLDPGFRSAAHYRSQLADRTGEAMRTGSLQMQHGEAVSSAGRRGSSRMAVSVVLTFIVSVVYSLSPAAGVAVGAAAAVLIASLSPVWALPLLLFGVMVRPVYSGLPLQDGWIVILAFLMGLIFYVVLRAGGRFRVDWWMVLLFAWAALTAVVGVGLSDGNVVRHLTAAVLPLSSALLVGLIRGGGQGGVYDKWSFRPQWVVGLAGLYAVMAVVIVLLKGHGLEQGPGGSISLRVAEISPRSVSIVLGGLIIIAAGVIAEHSWRARKVGWLIGAVVGASGVLVITGSRIALIGMALGLIPMFVSWLTGRRPMTIRWKRAFGVACVGGLLVMLTLVAPLLASWNVMNAVDLRALRALDWGAGGGRFEMWLTVLRSISGWEWLFGVGVPNWHEWIGGHPHSFFVSSLLYYGAPGLILVLGALSSLAYQACRARAAAGLGIAVYLAVVFMTSGFPDRPEFWVVYVLGFLAITMSRRHGVLGAS